MHELIVGLLAGRLTVSTFNADQLAELMGLIRRADVPVAMGGMVLPHWVNPKYNGVLEYCMIASKFITKIMLYGESEQIVNFFIDLSSHFNGKIDTILQDPEAKRFKLGFIKYFSSLHDILCADNNSVDKLFFHLINFLFIYQ